MKIQFLADFKIEFRILEVMLRNIDIEKRRRIFITILACNKHEKDEN